MMAGADAVDHPERGRVCLQNQPPSRPLGITPLRPQSPAAAGPYQGIDTLDPRRQAQIGTPTKFIAPPKASAQPEPAAAPKTHAQISHLYEMALTSAAMSFHEAALETIREVTSLAPDHAGAWRLLASLLRLAGRDERADAADRTALDLAESPQSWRDTEGERSPTRLDKQDRKIRVQLEILPPEDRIVRLREILFAHPLDVAAMRYLGNEEQLANDLITGAHVFERALALSPGYLAARADYARLLMAQRNYIGAYRQSDHLLAAAPNNLKYRVLRADAAMHMERFDEAVTIYEAILKLEPRNTVALNYYGNVLKAIGRRDDSVRAYRTQLSIMPAAGNAYYGLSEMKASYLTAEDVAAMRSHLAHGVQDVVQRKCMAYALAQTLERAGDYKASFQAYEFGGRVCREELAQTDQAHDPAAIAERLTRIRGVFTPEAMAARVPPRSVTRPATTPIFVLGMPRAGSTLVEQILASHSLVEGTRELPVVNDLTKRIALSRALVAPDMYPQRVLEYSRAELDALGAECLDGIARYRNTSLPYVIDKRPWNWLDIAFIHLILPQARFIDIRRAPMAAGFAMFKQLLPADAAFSFDLRHTGLYYRGYVSFMEHMDAILPGGVLRVSYENLVENTEVEIRRMLDYCGLPFEEHCLRFWETDRAVSTPSAEQVRRPIFRDALKQWRNFAPWLGPLKEALGDLAED
jgi:tetratricopeptide (TPR) repeat protein